MKKEEKSSKHSDKAYLWKWTAIIALLGLLPTASWNIYQFYSRLASGPQIICAAEYSSFSLPPQILATLPPDKFAGLKGQLNLSIRNSGDIPASEVRIQVKSKGVANLKWDDEKTESREFNTDIEVGKLPIGKSLNVTIWTENALSTNTDSPTIFHSTGQLPIELITKELSPELSYVKYSVITILVIITGITTYTLYKAKKLFVLTSNTHDNAVTGYESVKSQLQQALVTMELAQAMRREETLRLNIINKQEDILTKCLDNPTKIKELVKGSKEELTQLEQAEEETNRLREEYYKTHSDGDSKG